MPIIHYYITDRKERFSPILYFGQSIPKQLALPKAYKYIVGIDQSTTCTGIYIQDVNDTINFICDFQRVEDVGIFTEKLLVFLKKLLRDREVVQFVYEALPTGAKPNLVLEKLHKQISGWRTSDPIFSNLNPMTFDDIPPGMWKSHVYLGPTSEVANAFNTKSQIAAHICEQKPNLLPFLGEIKSKDYDAFDACGIVMGYLREHFLNGRYDMRERRIGGQTKFYDDVFCAAAKIGFVDMDGFLADAEQDLLPLTMNEKIPFLYWNEKYSFVENVRKALSYGSKAVTLVEDERVRLSLQFRYGIFLREREKLYLFVSKSRDLSKSQKEWFRKGERFSCELFK